MAKCKRRYDRGHSPPMAQHPPVAPSLSSSTTPAALTSTLPSGKSLNMVSLDPALLPLPFTIENVRAHLKKLTEEVTAKERKYKEVWVNLNSSTGGSIHRDILRYAENPLEMPEFMVEHGDALESIARLFAEKRAIERKVYDIAVSCSKAECQKFAKLFLRLPGELRNMVYAHAWEDDKTPALKSPWRWTCKHSKRGCRCFVWGDLCPWALHAWVGEKVAREAIQVYYRRMSFCFNSMNGYTNEISQFLHRDHFHLSVKPLDCLRYLKIDLHDIDRIYLQPKKRRLAYRLDLLCEMRVEILSVFCLEIFIHAKTQTLERIPGFMKRLYQVKDTLEDRGSTVNIWVLTNDGNEWVVWFDVMEDSSD